ncbi:hypothetical protein [Actinopolymorpha sp. B9G3]|uniref:hypothetical protein n=1 Tax=Actinopolymorpha sp. B9G3 TaxID=3158970 RepID=UPI0032D91ACE
MTDHNRNRLEDALRQTRHNGGNVYAFAFGYLASCIEHAYDADSLTEARTQLAAARDLIALIDSAPAPTSDPVPEGADPDRCAYSKFYGMPEWHEHDHGDCRDAVAEWNARDTAEAETEDQP